MSRAIERIRAALREPPARPTADATEGNRPEPMHASAEGIADAVIVMCRTLVEPRKSIVHLLRSWKAAVPLRPDAAVASASVVDITPSANLPKLIQPPESPGWRGDATVTAFRERLELRIRETVDQVARVAGHASGAQVTLKRFDRFLDCLCDAAAGAALAAAPRDAGREEVGYLIAVKAASPPKWLSGFEPDVRQRSLFGRTGEDLIVTRPLFTTLHHEAIRFSRREDADRAINAVAQDLRGLVEVEEHMWTDAGRAAPRDAGREEDRNV